MICESEYSERIEKINNMAEDFRSEYKCQSAIKDPGGTLDEIAYWIYAKCISPVLIIRYRNKFMNQRKGASG